MHIYKTPTKETIQNFLPESTKKHDNMLTIIMFMFVHFCKTHFHLKKFRLLGQLEIWAWLTFHILFSLLGFSRGIFEKPMKLLFVEAGLKGNIHCTHWSTVGKTVDN